MDGWFPQLSPDGHRVASGHKTIWVDGVEIGQGFHPVWADNDTIYYGRQPDGAFMRWRGAAPEVIRQAGFNFFHAAPGDRWQGYRPDTGLTWHDGVTWAGWAEGGLSATRWAARTQSNSHLYAGPGQGQDGQLIDSRGVLDPCLRGDALAWAVGTKIYGQRHHERAVEDLSLPGEEHFRPIPVLAEGQLYILTHTHDRLLLYKWGEGITDGWVVARGTTDFPDARFVTGTNSIRVVWSDRGELKQTTIPLDRPTERLIFDGPVEDTSGVPFDALPFFLPSLGRRQRTGSHEMCWHFHTDRITEIRFAHPDHWVALNWDERGIYLYEDRAQSEPSQNPGLDYSFTEDLWVKRFPTLNEPIDHLNNILIRFNPLTNQIMPERCHPFPYRTTVVKKYLEYDHGGVIGRVPTIVIEYWMDYPHGPREHSYLGFGWGLVKWEALSKEGHLLHRTVFNEIGGPMLIPLMGARDSQTSWPPPLMNVPGVTIEEYGKTIQPGHDWRVKVRDRNNPGHEFIVEIVNGSLHVTWKNPAGEDRSGSRRPVRVECGGGDPPPDPGPGPVDPPPPSGESLLIGQVGVEGGGGWRDAENAKNMIGCHLGDLLSLWFHNNPRAREVLGYVRQANYPFHRYWTTLGPGSAFWAGREVYPGAPGISPERYWAGHEDFLAYNRELGLKVIPSQGDIRPIVIPDRVNFANNMADLFDRQGPDLCFMFEGANESRDTGEPDPNRLADFVRVFKRRHPGVLCGLSAYTGHEDVNITNAFSREPADVFIVHGYRDGHYWDKLRHIFSFKYESRPNKRQGIQMEPFGFGDDVSASQNKHEIDAHVAQLAAAMSVMTNQAWVYFSGPGVRTDANHERLENMPGFWEVPKVARMIPHDVGRYDELFHGGDRFADRRVFAAVGELGRADHAYYRDGRFVCIMYGPDFHRCPQVRNARIDGDVTLGDKGRIVYGQVI
jgi:hypothetical protein